MSLATDKKRWDDLHAAYAKAGESANEYDRQLSRKYGSTYQPSWLKKGDRDKLDALRARADKIGDKIIELLVRVSPRGQAWLSGVPAHWIRSDLTWEDAIRPKNEPLSVTPPSAWGSTTPIQEAPMTQEHDAEAVGAQYAQDQINGDYFMDWVRSQLLEASRMDPSTVLPLETRADARVIARNMLKQLEWDTKRDLNESKEFFKGFSDTLRMNDAWLAGELLEINREMRGGGVGEALHEGGKQATKPGKHGTLRLWRIAYTDSNDPGFGEHSYQRWAYDKQAAWDDFNEEVNSAGESWEIVKIEPVLDTGPKRLSRETRESVSEARRENGRPLIDDKLYSITWRGGRAGPMSASDVVAQVRDLRQSWREGGRSGILEIQVWYRDGSRVPYADLERQVLRPGVSEAPRQRHSPFRIGQPVHTTMGVRRSGHVIAPVPRDQWTDGTYRAPEPHERDVVWVQWEDGTKGWSYARHLALGTTRVEPRNPPGYAKPLDEARRRPKARRPVRRRR